MDGATLATPEPESEEERRGRRPDTGRRDGESDDDYRSRLERNQRNRERYAERNASGRFVRTSDADDASGDERERPRPRKGTGPRSRPQAGDDAGTPTLGVETPEPEKKPKKSRGNAKKVTGGDVEKGTKLLFDGIAMFSGKSWWAMPDANKEVGPWSSEAAELINKIPTTYIKSAIDMSGYLAVGIGIFRTVSVRVAMDNAVRAKQMQQMQQESSTGDGEDIPSPQEHGASWTSNTPPNVRTMPQPTNDAPAVVSLREPIPGMMTGAVAN